MEKRAVEAYIQKDEPLIQKRRDRWKGWAASPDALRERQRRHRLLTDTRPREFAHRDSDPLEIAHEVLEHLGYVRAAVKANVRAREHLDQAEECIRQLGWGPEPNLPSP